MKRREERGFALLIVFVLAAAVALMLYQQIPRVAFESQRDKEETLIARGEQYKRAIQLYYIAYKKWPTKIEDLEDTNHKRYLRRRYIDPLTGKNEWRLVHVNGAGLLTDSLVQKAPQTPDGKLPQDPAQVAGNTTGSGTGTGTDAPPEVNAAVLQRPSDRPMVRGNLAGQPTSADPNNPNNPNYYPPITLTPPTGQAGVNPQTPQIPGQPGYGQQIPGQTGAMPVLQFPGQPDTGGLPAGFQPGVPGQGMPGPIVRPGQFRSQNPNLTTVGLGPNGQPLQPNMPPPQAPGDPSGAAVGMINNMLRTPQQTPQAASAFNNNPVMGGLAGVASTFKGPSIKVYKDRSKYQEWEFVLDLKQGVMPGQQQTGVQAPPGQQPQSGANPSPFSIGNTTGNTTGNATPGALTPNRPPQQ